MDGKFIFDVNIYAFLILAMLYYIGPLYNEVEQLIKK